MPQINRIRVNNVKYNFATQYYDDFIMRFNCKNTIYDLANGGGKSLLMLLLLQNMIPNCTLDEKQPIEKLFRQGGQNTCIHSLVEWKLDSAYIKDGFKYMTTGFCARKGKANEEEGEESVAAASSSATVEYFNYCIFYREFGDNDIKNLPLTSNGERVTYNGLKSYLRDLNKNDFKYEVYIFDKKGEYQSFITKYGIYESAWEIVRGINKTEGHVRTYFETNYKTSRKVIEDLLIEEIIQKSFNNRLSVESDEGKMAETLLDIKDKLVELSKKHAQISAYDSQMSAIDGFKEYLESYKDFYNRKNKTSTDLYNLALTAKYEVKNAEETIEEKRHGLEDLKESLDLENKNIAIAEVIEEQNSLNSLERLVEEFKTKSQKEQDNIDELEKSLSLYEALKDYEDYLEYQNNYSEVKVSLDGRLREDTDLVAELKQLAGAYNKLYKKSLKDLEEKKNLSDRDEKGLQAKYEDAKTALREADKELAGFTSLIKHNKDGIEGANKRLKTMMEEVGLLVAENADTDLISTDSQLTNLNENLEEVTKNYNGNASKSASLKEEINALKALNTLLNSQAAELEDKENSNQKDEERIKSICEIYGKDLKDGLCELILETYNAIVKDYDKLNTESNALLKFIENVKKRTYICDDPMRNKLKSYLISQYGDDVVEGHEWFDALPVGQRRDVIKRTPFVEYGFIIKNDFERVKNDETLANFGRGGVIFPVISEQILIDTKLEINKDLIVFALKDMNFLRDPADIERELKLANDEFEEIGHKLDTLKDRKELVWNDYTFAFGYKLLTENQDSQKTIAEIKSEIETNTTKLETLEANLKTVTSKLTDQEKFKLELEEKIEKMRHKSQSLKTIINFNKQIADVYKEVEELEKKIAEARERVSLSEENLAKITSQLDSAREVNLSYDKKIKSLNAIWDEEYSKYFEEGLDVSETFAIYEKDIKGLESRFLGLKTALNSKNVDVKDKETLMSHLKASIDKCVEQISYRGYSLDQIKLKYDEKNITKTNQKKLFEIKGHLTEAKKEHKNTVLELEAQEALYNRLDGSIAHGINQIETKYGEFKAFECKDPEGFMKQHKDLILKLKADLKEREAEIKSLESNLKDVTIIQKDLERIVKDAAMELPAEVSREDVAAIDLDLADYENVAKEYNNITKLEYKKVDEFAKQKQNLVDLLNGFNAEELAAEIKLSINIPDSYEKADNMINALTETNSLVELEKDRIHKGIEDMERIKDNFENRCIQTCSNIKTELDRLPKLSNINLDGEQISIISLDIPYVKEDFYKERMSDYIDETVVMAESFKDISERLKYIRNRLSWKRLFSVIVTDMNSIRVNLYKRERIKDQSRYLRYEEAVGSTGQSQGIYIQFLIAIINYISNMNDVAKEGVTGKTIFIDNPFGAAKDIYIWEPIFKLLATNHVQLIVPARGATPAIVGRFDVNYILGQKLVDNRQQTVVVDYYSNTTETELEYTRLDYEQASFDFVN
ncbi:hypothetical protein [Lachnospira sp.]|jgi:chromosome segregation ATPase|uniref:hypothetical protein n=1 Tax=Lachnospira sp. TaxID=2049031 RepID=UPI00257DEFDD|nr:hypothetical protein [Lachnospira sp.]